jgi:gamma-glutamylputrescine oxidase
VSLLHHLARRGLDACLVERAHLAAGASGRNAGFLLAGVASSYGESVHLFGRDKAKEIWQLTLDNHNTMLEAVAGQPVGYRHAGSIILPSSTVEARHLEDSAQLLREDGFEAIWDGRRLVNPLDGELDPCALVGALARQAAPGAINEGVEVTAIEAGAGSVIVRAGVEECQAEVVILATNAYTPQLVPHVAIQPKRAQILATAPFAERVCELPNYSHFGYRYWRQLEGGEVLVGGWRDTAPDAEVGYDEWPTPDIQAYLDEHVSALGVSAEVTHRWAGTMGFTESGLPFVGPVDGMPNVYVCGGYNGHGLGFAFASAKRLVESL